MDKPIKDYCKNCVKLQQDILCGLNLKTWRD